VRRRRRSRCLLLECEWVANAGSYGVGLKSVWRRSRILVTVPVPRVAASPARFFIDWGDGMTPEMAAEFLFLDRVQALCERVEAVGSIDALDARSQFGADEVKHALASGSLYLNGRLLRHHYELPRDPNTGLRKALGYPDEPVNAALTEALERIVVTTRKAGELGLLAFEQLEHEADAQAPSATWTKPVKLKRSTEGGDAESKIVAELTRHHKYADGGCLNLEPIGVNELARQAGVASSTASEFFNRQFNSGENRGHSKYRVICRNAGRLADSIKALRKEFSPHDLFGRQPPNEVDRDTDE
jgi:hypothetical protein